MMIQQKYYKFVLNRLYVVSVNASIPIHDNIYHKHSINISAQPPGIPEISKKSLTSCPATGGLELFIIGKNFLKDTRVVFTTSSQSFQNLENEVNWEESVMPDKEYLQQVSFDLISHQLFIRKLNHFFQTHLVCIVPSFLSTEIAEPVKIQIYILSSGKKSEPHNFMYTPKNYHTMLTAATTIGSFGIQNSEEDCQGTFSSSNKSINKNLCQDKM